MTIEQDHQEQQQQQHHHQQQQQHEQQQHQTVHAHVVEEILPHELTEVVTTDVKDVINQFLPTRKRKPRAKRPFKGKYGFADIF